MFIVLCCRSDTEICLNPYHRCILNYGSLFQKFTFHILIILVEGDATVDINSIEISDVK